MKERPILFRTEMVKAILEGRKTETRRIMKPQPKKWWGSMVIPIPMVTFLNLLKDQIKEGHKLIFNTGKFAGYTGPLCPYGIKGDRLWVRETWGYAGDTPYYFYKAGHNNHFPPDIENVPEIKDYKGGFRPSIHMPRAASRITLDVIDSYPEPLLSITPTGAMAEGVKYIHDLPNIGGPKYYFNYLTNDYTIKEDPIQSYFTLWDSINGKNSHIKNPAVWVIKFNEYGG